MRLSTQVTKLERNLNAKQVFCETIVTENEELKTKLQSLKDGKFFNKVREMKKELGDLTRTQADIKPAFRSQLQVSNEGGDQKVLILYNGNINCMHAYTHTCIK